MLEAVVIRKIKRPIAMIRWPAYVVGVDRHGRWLFSPKGTICRGQSGSNIGENEVGRGNRDASQPVMHLIPNIGWWTAAWSREPEVTISVDVCTPPRWIDGEWHYIDLELDPTSRSGRVEIHDEDEFVAACEEGLISREEAVEARAAAVEIERSLQQGEEPFGCSGWNKLDEALSLKLPPIRDLRHVES